MSSKLSEKRMEICRKCPDFVEKKGLIPARCGICSCLLVFKTELPMSKCPVKKW